MPAFRTLDELVPTAAGKRVLLRADLNVPVQDGRITDRTRIERLAPTIRELADKGGRVIVCSHFDRPKGKRVPEMSLKPMAEALAARRSAAPSPSPTTASARRPRPRPRRCRTARCCCWRTPATTPARRRTTRRWRPGLAKLADVFVNDAFSAAHRAHASTEGVARLLPAYAGRLMQAELEALDAALGNPARPVVAIVGGAKVSTKLDLLGNLTAQGRRAGDRRRHGQHLPRRAGPSPWASRCRRPRCTTPRGRSWRRRPRRRCEILLPIDLVVAAELRRRRADPRPSAWTRCRRT